MLFSLSSSSTTILKCTRRTLFSIPLSSYKSQTYHENRVLPYTPKQLYAVVADVASYPTFVPFCSGSQVDSSALERAMQKKTVVDAELTIGFMNFRESYVSTVTCIPYKSVQAVATSSTLIFKNLSTKWKFQSINSTTQGELENPPGPTLVSYDLTYQFADLLYGATCTVFFGQVAERMIKAFEDRCLVRYGQS